MNVHEQMLTPNGVKTFAQEWFDVALDDELATLFSRGYIKACRQADRAFGTAQGPGVPTTAVRACVWHKMRLNDRGLLPAAGPPPDDDAPGFTTAVLHVHFLTLAETEEMLERLRWDVDEHGHVKPARSKIFETVARQDVFPINATAARVAPNPEDA